MGLIEAIVLGFVQGFTEFLPISSSAHLVLVPAFLGWSSAPLSFDVFLHGGTLVSIIIFFWPEFIKYLKALFKGILKIGKVIPPESIFAYNLILSVIPPSIFGLIFHSRVEEVFTTPKLVSWLLLVTAAFLLIASRLKGKRELTEINWLDALVVGFAQGLALLPGISRSGATITAGRAMGLSREASAKFAFLVAIPTVGAAFVYSLYKTFKSNIPIQLVPSIAGFVTAAIVGYFSFFLFFKLVKRFGFDIFALYCVVLFIVAQILL